MLSLLILLRTLLAFLPGRRSLEARLADFPRDALPIEASVTIHWDDHQIPFIEAERDDDLAFALGMVHAHLRLGQMELLRRVAAGRIAEMAGPLGVEFDRVIRSLEVARAVPAIEQMLPDDTRRWLERFVEGVNLYQERCERLPHEFAALGLKREPWTLRDILTIGRLIAVDVNWMDYLPLLRLRGNEDWERTWRRLVTTGNVSLPSFKEGRRLGFLRRLLSGIARTGSNSFVVAGRRSRSGAGLIASDPHVSLMLPSLWLVAGYKSPTYHCVGLMFPALPLIAVGRNPDIGWGGTNMHAASSDLYDVSGLEPDRFEMREERVRVRGWFPKRITVRESPFGPVLSDAKALGARDGPPLALRWIGHEPSDEFTALLAANRARDWDEFRAAFKDFAVSGMNMLFADKAGNIGQVLAVRLPRRRRTVPPDLVLDATNPEADWDGTVGSAELPHSFNPPEGYLVSANNRPVESSVPIGYFFSPADRIQRISALLAEEGRIGLDRLKHIQRDVQSISALELKEVLLDKLRQTELTESRDPWKRDLVKFLSVWDGRYHPDSRGALSFELLMFNLARLMYGQTFTLAETATYASVGRIKPLMTEDLEAMEPDTLADTLGRALERAAERLSRLDNWGSIHRYALWHPLGAIPVVGRRYRFFEYEAPGASDTVMKTAHGLSDQRHRTGYGAAARHVSDLADPDDNHFVLLGGQDGWINGANFIDQVPLWLERAYVRVPLRLDTVRRTFPYRTVFQRKGG